MFQLLKYSGDFDHFIPHTISILLKNIGHDCGNTSHDKSSSVPKWMSTLPCKAMAHSHKSLHQTTGYPIGTCLDWRTQVQTTFVHHTKSSFKDASYWVLLLPKLFTMTDPFQWWKHCHDISASVPKWMRTLPCKAMAHSHKYTVNQHKENSKFQE